MHFPKSIGLSGADKFILALESSGRAKQAEENVCIYRLDFGRDFDCAAFREKIRTNAVVCYLSSLRLSGASNNFNTWKAQGEAQPLLVETQTSVTLSEDLASQPFDLSQNPPLRFVLSKSAEGTVLFVIWHHLLMDGYGATLLLRHLNGEEVQVTTARTVSRFNWKNFSAARQAKRFIEHSARGRIHSVEHGLQDERKMVRKLHLFTAEQHAALRENAVRNQSKFGLGNYLLVLCARAVHRTFHEGKPATYWIPIPQDTRKKNAQGPLIGNQLSFLFYRLEIDEEKSEKELVAQLDAQMMAQIRAQIPMKYGHLLNFMRRFHPRWYYRLLTGPSGTSLTSFLYTYAPEHPQSLMEMQGHRVQAAINLPPNSYPPGLTFSVHTFGDEMMIQVQSYAHILSPSRAEKLDEQIRQLLLQAE